MPLPSKQMSQNFFTFSSKVCYYHKTGKKAGMCVCVCVGGGGGGRGGYQ